MWADWEMLEWLKEAHRACGQSKSIKDCRVGPEQEGCHGAFPIFTGSLGLARSQTIQGSHSHGGWACQATL